MSDSPWIPVEEMLPESFQLVWVWQQMKDFSTPSMKVRFQFQASQGYLRAVGGWCVCGPQGLENVMAGTNPNVTHWMPLPPAPPGQKYWTLDKGRM